MILFDFSTFFFNISIFLKFIGLIVNSSPLKQLYKIVIDFIFIENVQIKIKVKEAKLLGV